MAALNSGLKWLVAISVGLSACSRSDGDDGPQKRYFAYLYTTRDNNSSILHPYPPLHSTWNFAIEVDDQSLRVPAIFAAETDVLNDYSFLNQQDYDHYRLRVSRLALHGEHYYRTPYSPRIPITGGQTHRVVGVERMSDTAVAVSMCGYQTPGVFRRGGDGQLEQSSESTIDYRLAIHTVELTRQEDAFDNRAPQARWLVTDIRATEDSDYQASVCEPYKPEPFVISPPEPR